MKKIRRYIPLIICILLFALSALARRIKIREYKNYYLARADTSGNGLTAFYYNNPEHKGEPAYVTRWTSLSLKNKKELRPHGAKTFAENDFSISVFGTLSIDCPGRYRFMLTSDDGSRLFLDGKPTIINDGIHPKKEASGAQYLKKGMHTIKIEYFQAKGDAVFRLGWNPPKKSGMREGDIPLNILHPAPASFDANTAGRIKREISQFCLTEWITAVMVIAAIISLRTGFAGRWRALFVLSIKNNPAAFIIIAAGAVLRGLFMGSVPGIHGDEAFWALRSLSLLSGRPEGLLHGMNSYTGPYFLLLAPVFTLFGYNTVSLRTAPLIFNTLALISCYALVKRYCGKRTALFSILILTVWPATFAFGRLNNEFSSLSLLFIFTALHLLSKAKPYGFILAGGIMGAGIYNHLIFISFPLALFVLGIIEKRGRLFLSRGFYLTLAPLLLVLSIRFLDPAGFSLSSALHNEGVFSAADLLRKAYQAACSAVFVLPHIINGDFVYMNFTGRQPVPVIPLNLFSIFGGFFILLRKRGKNLFRLFCITAVVYAVIFLNVDGPQVRYYYIPCSILALFCAVSFGKWADGRKIYRYAAWAVISSVTAVNIFYISVNYFAAFKKTGGADYCLYDKRYKNPRIILSHPYTSKKTLYNYLVKTGFRRISADPYTVNALMFYDIGNNILVFSRENGFKAAPSSCLLLHAEPVCGRSSVLSDFGYTGLRERDDIKNFRIYSIK